MTTTALITTGKQSPLVALATKFCIEPNKLLEVMRGTIIKPDRNGKQATNEEVAAFCIVADQYNLNPFVKEIHAFASGDKGIVPIVGIDGWTKVVNSRGDFDGCEFDDQADDKGNPVAVTCRMFVKDRSRAVAVTERFSECKRGTIPWNTMPWRMLRHKAYMQAARYAFGLAGIYDEDEARDIQRNAKAEAVIVDVPEKAVEVLKRKPQAIAAPVEVHEPEIMPEETHQPAQEAISDPYPVQDIPEGVEVSRGLVERVTKKDGKQKNGSAWSQYGIKVDGEFHSTFSETIGKNAQEAMDMKLPVELQYVKNERGFRDAKAIRVIETDTTAQDDGDQVPM